MLIVDLVRAITIIEQRQSFPNRLDASQKVECPANSVPAEMRQTGMEGACNDTRQEANAGADRERAAAN